MTPEQRERHRLSVLKYRASEKYRQTRRAHRAKLAALKVKPPRKTRRDRYESRRPAIIAQAKAWYRSNREHALQRIKGWQRSNRDRVRSYKLTRRASGRLSTGRIAELLKLQRGRCACCRCSLETGYHVDHIEAISRGGTTTDSNVQLLCPPCNHDKAASDSLLFMQSRGFLL